MLTFFAVDLYFKKLFEKQKSLKFSVLTDTISLGSYKLRSIMKTCNKSFLVLGETSLLYLSGFIQGVVGKKLFLSLYWNSVKYMAFLLILSKQIFNTSSTTLLFSLYSVPQYFLPNCMTFHPHWFPQPQFQPAYTQPLPSFKTPSYPAPNQHKILPSFSKRKHTKSMASLPLFLHLFAQLFLLQHCHKSLAFCR